SDCDPGQQRHPVLGVRAQGRALHRARGQAAHPARVPAEHHRVHGRPGVRGGRHRQGRGKARDRGRLRGGAQVHGRERRLVRRLRAGAGDDVRGVPDVSGVRLERNGLVATITLDRPETRNALDRELMTELTQLFGVLATDGTRVIVLTGAGDVFCAGADVAWMLQGGALDEDANLADANAARTMFETIDSCPRPVVARVNGHALGGGAGLVACADVAVAVSGARFGFTETRLGLIPATISPYVLRTIGAGHARALFTTGERFEAAR